MKTLEGPASEILYEWVKGRYEVFYKYDGETATQIELYETATKTSFLPSEEVEHYLEIILESL